MTGNSVMFTALPSGVVSATSSGTVVSLSVYVTPQLAAAASLSSVQSFVDWPSVVSGLTFAVTLGTTATAPQAICTLDPRYADHRFDSSLWASIFGPPPNATVSAIAVNQHAVPNYTTSGILSYNAAAVGSAIRNAYSSVAALRQKPVIASGATDTLSTTTANVASALNVPSPTTPGMLVNTGSLLVGQVQQSVTPGTPSLSQAALKALQTSGQVPTNPMSEFTRVSGYHNRKNCRNLVSTTPPGATTTVQVDFHQIVGQLADHPAVLRRLGLIIDLQLTLPPNANIDGPANIFVAPTTTLPDVGYGSPITYCVIHPYGSASAVAFRPYYGDMDVPGGVPGALIDTNGLLWADNTAILTVDDLDVDHAAIHVANYAEKAQNDLAATPAAQSLEVTLPALRTTGFALHHLNREALIGLRFANNASWTSGNTFVAEDFYRGFRVDVRTVTQTTAGTTYGAWTSLCSRQASFSFLNGQPTVTINDEGYVKSSAMSAAPQPAGTIQAPIYNVNESLFHWDGWSLVASRPGLSVGSASSTTNADGGAGPLPTDGPITPTSSGASLNLPFTTAIAPQPGSLTRLRFGTTYQFRVRAVDLAGNDMQHSAATDNPRVHATPQQTFSRYEPVSPPNVQLRRPVTEGESVEHLVIRSDPYASPPVHAADWAAKNTVASTDAGAAGSTGMNPYYATSERHISPPKTSVQMAEWHGSFDAALQSVPAAQKVQAAWAIACKEDGGYYDAHVTDSTTGYYRSYPQPGRLIVTPPAAAPAVALARASGQPAFTDTDEITPRGTALQNGQYVVFDTDSVLLPYLPDPNAAGVAIQGLPAGTSFRTFGGRANNPSGGSWPELSTWRLVLAESTGALTVAGLDPAPSASSPVVVSLPAATKLELTYSSTLNTLAAIHAFCPPTTAADAGTNAARTGTPPAPLPVARRSRSSTPSSARWPLASSTATSTRRTAARARPPRRSWPRSASTARAAARRRASTPPGTEVRRPGERTANPNADPPRADPPLRRPSTRRSPRIAATTRPRLTKTVRQLFGDTKRRDITYATRATTRFREYFPSSITSDSTNITNTTAFTHTISCKASARPPIPKVLYAVPSFLFNSSTSGATTTSSRAGGIVRVYVDRGWYASGTDERLGVVLAAQPISRSPPTPPASSRPWGRSIPTN